MGRKLMGRLSNSQVREALDQGLVSTLEAELDMSEPLVVQINPIYKQTLSLIARHKKISLSQLVRLALDEYTVKLPMWKEFYQQNIIEFYQEQLQAKEKQT